MARRDRRAAERGLARALPPDAPLLHAVSRPRADAKGAAPLERERFTFVPRGPYSLAATAARFTRFPEVVDRFDGTAYRRLLPLGRSPVLLEVRQRGTVGRAELQARLTGPEAGSVAARRAALSVVQTGLGAALDVRGFYRAFRGDPLLGRSLRSFRGLRIAGTPSLWEALVTAVLSQQVNLPFAYDIRRELALAFGRRARFAGETYVAFPTPERLARESPGRLRSFRLSAAKAGTLQRMAEAFSSGEISEAAIRALPDEEAIAKLTELKGIGRWTAEIGLLRGLGRADVFPGADLGVVKYLAMRLLGHPERATEKVMRGFAERWRPWRGLALVYAYAETFSRGVRCANGG
jgi:DNA-3-methyladenine glycosylase II